MAGVVLLWMGALTVCDVRHRRLPNALTLPGAAVILLTAVAAGRGVPALAGSAALTGIYLLVHLVAPAAMGPGTSSSRSAVARWLAGAASRSGSSRRWPRRC